MTSAAADVINHNRRKIGRFKPFRFCYVRVTSAQSWSVEKLQWKSLVVLVHDCRVYSANMGMRSSQYSRFTSSCLQSITLEGYSWRRHQMKTFSALLALCAGNVPATGEFPTQKGQWRGDLMFTFTTTQLRSLWRHCNVYFCFHIMFMWLCVGKLVYFSFDAQEGMF